MAPATTPSAIAGFLPEDMVQGGLSDDFDAVIREARWVDWDYDKPDEGNTGIFVRVKFERTDLPPDADPDEKFMTHYWSAGSLDFFRPGNTMEEGETSGKEGIYPKRVGTRTALTNSTNWAQALRSMVDAQVPRDRIKPEITWLEGLKGHWNRLPKDKKGGQFKDQPERKNKRDDVLCLTRFDSFEGVVAAGKPNGKTATATSSATPSGSATGSVDEKITNILVTALTPDSPVKKSALTALVLKGLKGDKDAQKAVKRVVETAFLESLADHNILFDADEGTVTKLNLE